MSPGWAGRTLAALFVAGIGGLPVIPAMTGCLASADAQEVAAPPPPPPNEPGTAGHAPGAGFFIDLRTGFDPKTQYISDFDIEAETVLVVLRKENVTFDADGMTLTARRSSEEQGKPYTMGEFQKKGFYGFGRYEAVIRVPAAEGVVSAFFTHTSRQFGDPHTEIDFEFVGRKPREAHLNYFVDGKNVPVNVDLWFDASQAEHLYAFEWTPDSIVWYVDGRKVRTVKRKNSPIGIPTNSSRVIASVLAGARATEEWVGTPDFESASALFSCISHVPIGQTGKQCSDTFTPPAP
ncbi:MAG: family 16 glycosylhydrolase [Hyphomonadaceae bacterium]